MREGESEGEEEGERNECNVGRMRSRAKTGRETQKGGTTGGSLLSRGSSGSPESPVASSVQSRRSAVASRDGVPRSGSRAGENERGSALKCPTSSELRNLSFSCSTLPSTRSPSTSTMVNHRDEHEETPAPCQPRSQHPLQGPSQFRRCFCFAWVNLVLVLVLVLI